MWIYLTVPLMGGVLSALAMIYYEKRLEKFLSFGAPVEGGSGQVAQEEYLMGSGHNGIAATTKSEPFE